MGVYKAIYSKMSLVISAIALLIEIKICFLINLI